MEMEDHHHNQYNIDLRHFITGGDRPPHFPPPPLPSSHSAQPPPPSLSVDLFSRNHHQLPHHYDMMMLMPRGGCGLHEFPTDSTSPATAAACVAPLQPLSSSLLPSNSGSTTVAGVCSSTPTALCTLDADTGSFGGGGDGGTGRWPRQETLTLLEIRSRLDSKFKEANQKGPLWDEVSRIMSEEHGYQRSGKKCREKFENLYKYYKKTKEGKAGRQDGKHYRFFRQLEALYGETSNPCSNPDSQFGGSSVRFHTAINASIQANHENFHSHKICDSLSLSNSSDFETCSSEDDDHDLSTATLLENDSSEKRRKRRSWKAKIKEFIDSQMRKLIEKQETWLEKLTKTLEQKEQERMLREEEWRNQEAARVEKEHKFWAKERAWIEARDTALMDTLRKLTGGRQESTPDHHQVLVGRIRTENSNDNNNELSDQTMQKSITNWDDSEVTRLVQLRTGLEPRFQQCGSIEEEESLWKEIARKLGYEKNPLMCKEKWDSVSNYNRKIKEIISSNNKKRKDNSSNSCYYQSNYNTSGGSYCEQEDQETTNAAAVNESCFPFLISEGGEGGGGENLWENYGLKLSKGIDHHHHQNQ